MADALDRVLAKLRDLDAAQRDEVADAIEKHLVRRKKRAVYQLSPEERELIEEGIAELDRGEVATEDEVRAVFRKYTRS